MFRLSNDVPWSKESKPKTEHPGGGKVSVGSVFVKIAPVVNSCHIKVNVPILGDILLYLINR